MITACVRLTFLLAAVSSASVWAESLVEETCRNIHSAIARSSGVCWPDSLTTLMSVLSLEEHSCENAISNSSSIYWPGSDKYSTASSHWASSSSDRSACAVEPGSSDDLATMLKIIGANRVPFAIKSGGHTGNPGFSSTPGVQISLSGFSEVTYDEATSTVRVGSGLLWDQVYTALDPLSVTVVGGRVNGPGVGGVVTGGGGYSWKSNQYGLTVDTITAYDLVLPNGTFLAVTDASHPDLFWALKGGYSNYGVVTTFTMKAVPQGQVWGGVIVYTENRTEELSRATAKFSENNKDPKAAIITAYNFVQGSLTSCLLPFYDAPAVPNGVFDEFLEIESVVQDVSTRSYSSLVKSSPSPAVFRTAMHTVSLLGYSQNLLDMIANEARFWGNKLQPLSLTALSYGIEPFHGASMHATPSAYPHDTPLLPLVVLYSWTDAGDDDIFTDAIKESIQMIYEAALAEGQDISIRSGKQIRYPNYSLRDTPLEQMYGGNVERLKQIRAQYDPTDVMSLAGGFRF